MLAPRRPRRADRHRDRDPLRAAARPSPTPPSASASAAAGCSPWRPEHDVALAAAGTHPWANYLDQQIIDTEHYNRLRDELRWVAQRNNTWSLHVHVGVRGADRAIAVCDWLRELLPLLLAASANSPFLDGRDTGPALGPHRDLHPHLPALRGPRAVRRLGDLRGLRRAARRDRRRSSRRPSSGGACGPHHAFGTVEVRICDAQTEGDESLELAGADRGLRRPGGASTIDEGHGEAPRWPIARSRRTCGGRSATAWTAR